MNNSEKSHGVGERLSFSKLFSEKGFKVEVPIIQRDYAQGRESESDVRASFLDSLYSYLEKGDPNRDLDFVYGSIVGEDAHTTFTPLDGQQRLTTLFLLHWYLAQISGQSDVLREILCKKDKSLFSYETRTSSSEFCDSLMAKDIDMSMLLKAENGVDSLSVTIKDKSWFYLSWMSDPTIQSMLVMLDAIHAKFEGCSGYFEKLVASDSPVITFLFLDLKQFKLTDDLYIKMNARGKPLTAFENFKAKLEQAIKSMGDDKLLFRLSFKDQPVTTYEYFIHKIDTDWADVFWVYRNELNEDDTFDDELMNFFALVIANYHVLHSNKETEVLADTRDNLFGKSGRLERLSFHDYEELSCISQGLVTQVITMMDLVQNGAVNADRIKPYQKGGYYSEEEYFKKVIANNTTYSEKLRFYAFYSYLANDKDLDGLQAWLRVVFNLTENTIINDNEEYNNALVVIHKLSNEDKSVLELLRDDCVIGFFIGGQVLEERIKAHLISRSKDWESLITSAEKHPYFRGQIGFILKFSGVLDFYLKNGSCNWENEDDSKYAAAFNRYARSATAVFDFVKDGSDKIDYLWERSVLSKGQYFTSAGENKWNLLSSNGKGKNVQRDHSWRTLLRLPVINDKNRDAKEAKQEYVKNVFDDALFDVDDIKASLSKICKKSLVSKLEPWKKELIKDDGRKLFSLCSQGFIVKSENEVVLLHHSGRNHSQSELFSRVFDLKLRESPNVIKPFKQLDFESAKSGSEDSYVSLGNWVYGDNEYEINVWFSNGTYKVLFYNEEEDLCAVDLIKILDLLNFKSVETLPDASSYSEYKSAYLFEVETIEMVYEILEELFSKLRDLINE